VPQVRIEITLDGILVTLCRVPGEVADLVGIKFCKQGGGEVDGKARMPLVKEKGSIYQALCATRITCFPGNTYSQVQVGDDKGQLLFAVVVQCCLQQRLPVMALYAGGPDGFPGVVFQLPVCIAVNEPGDAAGGAERGQYDNGDDT
jgi:hypothetical protein